MLVLLAAGVVARRGLWALAAPRVAGRGDPGESRVAVDGLLALLQLGAGARHRHRVGVVPGPRSRRSQALWPRSGAARRRPSARLGAAPARAPGAAAAPAVAVLWPLDLAVLTALRPWPRARRSPREA